MLARCAPIVAASALAAACSSSSKETRTADNQAGASQWTATAQGTPVQESPATGTAIDIASGTPAGTSGTTTSTRGAIEGPRGAWASGEVARVDRDRRSVVLDQPTGPAIVIVIDDNTDFVDANGRTISEGIAGLHEGQQVRASMDRSSNHADRVQVTKDARTQR
jgi:hypothetical protein